MALSPRWPQSPSTRDVRGAVAKAGALAAMVLAVLVAIHYIFVGYYDPYRCNALLTSGAWPSGDGHRLFEKWEPDGCRMAEYSRDDFKDCLSRRRLIFVGDSTTRQLFFAAAKRLDFEKADEKFLEVFVSENIQHDVSLEVEKVQLEFIWDPWLNSSRMGTELRRFRRQTDWGAIKEKEGDAAALIVLGAPGLWAARNGGDGYFALFQQGLETARPYLVDGLGVQQGIKVPFNDLVNQILVAPVQVPWYAKLPSRRAETLSPDRIDSMNNYLRRLPSSERSHVIGIFNQMTNNVEEKGFVDTGLHINEALAERWIDIVLNARCNNALKSRAKHANHLTCCVSYPSHQRGQVITVAFLAMAPLILWASRRKMSSLSRRLPPGLVLQSVAVIGAVIACCYLADRTHLLTKAEKHYSQQELAILWTLFALCCFASVCRSAVYGRQAGRSKIHGPDAPEAGFLTRDVTDEWKGWMQGPLLLIAFQETDDTLGLYKLTRLFGACYVFLSTFGHTTYFLRTEDFSFRRVLAVLVRLNAMTCLMGLVLRSDWTVYVFPQVISFWFIVTYATLRVLRGLNAEPLHLIGKILGSAAILIALTEIPGAMGAVGKLLNMLVPIAWPAENVKTWLTLDSVVGYSGMLAALLAHRGAYVHARQREQPGRRLKFPSPVDNMLFSVLFPDQFTAPVQPIVTVFALAFFLIFLVETQNHARYPTRNVYHVYHPFIAPVAVLSLAVLRNGHAALRAAHLWLPAALGRVALETSVLRRHMVQSGDGSGALRSGLFGAGHGGGWLAAAAAKGEAALLACVCVWAAAEAQRATRRLAAWVAGLPGEGADGEGGRDEEAGLGEYALQELGGGAGRHSGAGLKPSGSPKPSTAPAGGAWSPRRAAVGSWLDDARVRAGGLVFVVWLVNLIY